MSAHSRNFGSSLPSGTDRVGTFYSEIDDFKDDIKQRLTLDHYMDDVLTDGANNQDGRHRQVTMKEKSSDPSNLANTGIVYTKDVDDVTELFYLDDSGNAVQITDDGSLNLGSAATLMESLNSIITEFVEVTGNCGSASPGSFATNNIAFPSGYTYDTCIIFATNLYDSDNSAYRPSTVLKDDSNGEGAAIYMTSSYIVLLSGEQFNGQAYKIILGKLA